MNFEMFARALTWVQFEAAPEPQETESELYMQLEDRNQVSRVSHVLDRHSAHSLIISYQ